MQALFPEWESGKGGEWESGDVGKVAENQQIIKTTLTATIAAKCISDYSDVKSVKS